MNWEHLRAILWLRWRASVNRWRRAGTWNMVITITMVASTLASSVLMFFACIAGGAALSRLEPDYLMWALDVVILSFLFCWIVGVLASCQNTDLISLDRLLTWPLSLSNAFVLNYVTTSLFSMSLLMALAASSGLGLGVLAGGKAGLLLVLPLMLSFLFLVTSVTYLFRGWLVTLMENKRRRRTVGMIVMLVIVTMSQLPMIANMAFMQRRESRRKEASERLAAEFTARQAELSALRARGEIDSNEFMVRTGELHAERSQRNTERSKEEFDEAMRLFHSYVRQANRALPLVWPAYSARQAADDNVLPGIVAVLGMTAVGVASLWQASRTELRFRRGFYSRIGGSNAARPVRPAKPATLLEKRLPGVSEPVSAVALVAFRVLLRAPETKMTMLLPFIFSLSWMSVIAFSKMPVLPPQVGPFLALVALGMAAFSGGFLMANMFGMDRGGFRTWILMPVSRRDLLIGRNLATAPFVLGIALVGLLVVNLIVPLSLTVTVATLLQCIPIHMLSCLLFNASSILFPSPRTQGTSQPVRLDVGVILGQMVTTVLSPLTVVPGLAAAVGDLVLVELFEIHGLSIYLVATIVELAAVWVLYRRLVAVQGRWLFDRETRILDAVLCPE